MTAWASIAEVASITGQAVTEAQLNTAQSVIDITSNRTVGASGVLSARDLHWLRAAVAWQAVWQAAQPGYAQRNDVTSVQQDGLTTNFTTDGVVLAPLAKRALNRLSWKKSRSLRTSSVFQGNELATDPLRDAADDDYEWEPLS